MSTEIDRRLLVAETTYAIREYAKKFLEPGDYQAIYTTENFDTWLEFAYIDPYKKMPNTILIAAQTRLWFQCADNIEHSDRMACETIVYQMRNFAGLVNSSHIKEITAAINGDISAKEMISRRHCNKTEKIILRNIISSAQWVKLWGQETLHLYRTDQRLQAAALMEIYLKFPWDVLEIVYDYLQYAYGSEDSEVEINYIKGIIGHLNSPNVLQKLKKEAKS